MAHSICGCRFLHVVWFTILRTATSRFFRCPSPIGVGEYTYNVRYFHHKRDVYLTPGIYRLEENISVNRCFSICDLEQECVLAVLDESGRKCALAYITTENAQLMCADTYDNNLQDITSNLDSEFLYCGSGCRAMEKLCTFCNHTALDMLIMASACSGQPKSLSQICLSDDDIYKESSTEGSTEVTTSQQTETEITSTAPATTTSATDPSTRFVRVRSDSHVMCAEWAELGECQFNQGFMCTNCKVACGTVCEQGQTAEKEEVPVCKDQSIACPTWKLHCHRRRRLYDLCPQTCNSC